MMGNSSGTSVIALTMLAPLLTMVVLGGNHHKITLGQNKQVDSKSAEHVINHVKKQSKSITDSHGSLLFDPPLLDFGDCAVSVVWRQKVQLQNTDISASPITVISISGSSIHFHCSFVADKVISAMGNTSFEVVFLGREEGYVEDKLFINTSHGVFPYRISARGVSNPFLVKPFVNVKIPVNTTFSPLIHLYNPFASPLQVMEMFGSSCDLHLEMSMGGEMESESLDWWIVPPRQTKVIGQFNFLAMRAVNLTAFVRIRTNYTAHPYGTLMLPVSVEVTNQALLFCPQHFLDFGSMKPTDPPKTLKVFVINSGSRPITIQSAVASPPNEGLSIEFAPLKVPPSLTTPTLAALVTFSPLQTSNLRTISGRIVFKSKTGQYRATVGYQVAAPASYLHYNASSTKFLATAEAKLPICQPFVLSNEFALPIRISNVSLDTQDYIEIGNVTHKILKTREQALIAELCLVKMPSLITPYVVPLHLETNVSSLEVPVSVFTGKLIPVWPTDGEGNETSRFVGWLSEGSSKELYLALRNPNPVGVALQGWGTNSTNAILTYLGTEMGEESRFRNRSHFTNLTMATAIRPGHYAVFQVQIHPHDSRKVTPLLINVRTVYETVVLTLNFRMMTGNIWTVPVPLQWNANFLDPYLTTDVRLNSTLKQPVTVVGFQAPPPYHNKLSFDFYSNSPVISGMQSAGIAKLAYPLDWNCAQTLLTKLVGDWQLGERWWNAWNDLDIASSLYRCYESLTRSIWKEDMSVKLVTKEIGYTDLPLKVNVQWPRLAVKSRIQFPLTEVGHQNEAELKLINPTSSVVLAQVLWLHHSQVDVNEFISKLPSYLKDGIDLPDDYSPEKQQAFTLTTPTIRGSSSSTKEGISSPSQESIMVFLTPNSQAQLGVTFTPTSDETYHSLLVIKNNITGLEMVSLSAQGQWAKFRLGNQKPGSTQPLTFDMTVKHLKNCNIPSQNRFVFPSVTVKQTFTARNQGLFPIVITGFDINDSPCEGYGFRVLQCEPLTLLPNQSRLLEIAFTPDFTQTRIQRTLRLHSSIGGGDTLNFTLVATLPTQMLILCAAILPRPSWEVFLYYSTMIFSAFLLLCVITAATLEADRMLKTGLIAMITIVSSQPEYSSSTTHLLDLKAVAKEELKQPEPVPIQSSETKQTRSKKGKGKKCRTPQNPTLPSSSPSPTAPVTMPPIHNLNKGRQSLVIPVLPVAKRVSTSEEDNSSSSTTESSHCRYVTTPMKDDAKKDEFRQTKPKAAHSKKNKTKTVVTPSDDKSSIVSKGSGATEAKKTSEKRTRSSSVPSDRNKATIGAPSSSEPAIKSSPKVESKVTVSTKTDKPPTTSTLRSTAVQPLKKNISLLGSSQSRPQPPVGKILPEVRRQEEIPLPKPIGYRYKEKPVSVQWNTISSVPWAATPNQGIDSSANYNSGVQWWSEDSHTLFSRPSSSELTCDRYGLRSLASDLSSSVSRNVDPWPVVSTPSLSVRNTWDVTETGLRTEEFSNNTLDIPPVSRTYSPWSVPHWLDVTQRNESREDSAQVPVRTETTATSFPHYGPFQSTRNFWEPSQNNVKEPWPSYSQF